MNWLELTIETAPGGIDTLAAALAAGGFADLVLEDQDQMEEFLEENRQYWDYIDEELQQKLQGLSRIKLYIEKADEAALSRHGADIALCLQLPVGALDGIGVNGKASRQFPHRGHFFISPQHAGQYQLPEALLHLLVDGPGVPVIDGDHRYHLRVLSVLSALVQLWYTTASPPLSRPLSNLKK